MAELVIKLVNGELAGKTMQQINKEAAAAAQALKKAEIGTKEWVDAHNRLEKAKGLQQDLTNQIKSTNVASATLKQQFLGILGQVPGFSQLSGAIGNVTGGVGGLTSGFGILKGAIISTGIGALVVLLGSLFAWFQKTERGADLLAKASAAIGAAWNVLIDRGSKLIDALVALTRGDFSEAADKFAEAHRGVVDEIVKETAAAWKLADAMDALEERENDFILTQAKARREHSELAKIYEDQSKSTEKRMNAVNRAMEVERKANAEQLAMGRERIRLALQLEELSDQELQRLIENGVKLEEVGMSESLEEDRKKAIQAVADFVTLQGELADRETELIKKKNAILKKDRREDMKDQRDKDKEEKALRDAQLKAWEEYFESRKSLEDLTVQAMSASREKDLAQLELSLMRQIEALDNHSPFYAERLAKTQEIARQKRKEVNDKWDEQDLKDELAHIKTTEEQKQIALLESLMKGDITRQQFDQLAYENQITSFDAQMALLQEQGMVETEEFRKVQEAKLNLVTSYEQRIQQARKATFDAIVSFANTAMDAEIANIERQNAASARRLETIKEQHGQESLAYKTAQADIEQERKKNGERIKKFEKKKVGINLFSEIANIWMNANSFPFPYSAIIGGILTAAALLRANQNMKQIDSQQFELGGPIRGPRHSGGGVNINAEGGEFIFSRKAVSAIGMDRLNQVNDFYTRRFEAGGPVDPFERSTPSASAPSTGTAMIAGEGSMMNEKLDQVISVLQQWPKSLKVYSLLTETEDGIKTLNEIRSNADV